MAFVIAGLWANGLTTLLGDTDAPLAQRPPQEVFSVDTSISGGHAVTGSGSPAFDQSIEATTLVAFERHSIGQGPVYWGMGLQADYYHLTGNSGFPIRRLQDYAAQFSLEYFTGAEQVAELSLRPGLYFQSKATRSSWDIPIDLVTGIPITNSFFGVVGFSTARFYANPVPVAGFVWVVNSTTRFEAVFPEPSLVLKLGRDTEARLTGELTGGGFRTDPGSMGSSVEYFSYRVGGAFSRPLGKGFKITCGAGCEVLRKFTFRGGPSLRSNGAPYAKLAIEYTR